jgi:hypothetical protein
VKEEKMENQDIILSVYALEEKQINLEDEMTNRIEKDVVEALVKANEEETRTMTQAEVCGEERE